MKRLQRKRYWYVDEIKDIIASGKDSRSAKLAALIGAMYGVGLGLLFAKLQSPVEETLALLFAVAMLMSTLASRRMRRWAKRADYLELRFRHIATELCSRQQRFRADDFRMAATLRAVCDDHDFAAFCFKGRVTGAGLVEYCTADKGHDGACVWTAL